jgi:hypothetical protein
MAKHSKPEPEVQGKPIGNTDPKKRGRGGEPPIGQPSKKGGKHSK